ncbi:hypothetical protein Scep_018840 [Stephania cephalantha]|uniref:Uncharacterized protein n=1 Tax=Stephania cephalantha TaxID=152367 RepID=A0AAP0I9M1_9MAGN
MKHPWTLIRAPNVHSIGRYRQTTMQDLRFRTRPLPSSPNPLISQINSNHDSLANGLTRSTTIQR